MKKKKAIITLRHKHLYIYRLRVVYICALMCTVYVCAFVLLRLFFSFRSLNSELVWRLKQSFRFISYGCALFVSSFNCRLMQVTHRKDHTHSNLSNTKSCNSNIFSTLNIVLVSCDSIEPSGKFQLSNAGPLTESSVHIYHWNSGL